jgi:hypothetical protein
MQHVDSIELEYTLGRLHVLLQLTVRPHGTQGLAVGLGHRCCCSSSRMSVCCSAGPSCTDRPGFVPPGAAGRSVDSRGFFRPYCSRSGWLTSPGQ